MGLHTTVITVVTAVAGYFDYLRAQPVDPNARYICFTDQYQPSAPPWEVQPLPREFESRSLNSRIPKIVPHLFFGDDYLIWQDGTHVLKQPPSKVVGLLGSADIALMQHPARNCLYAEAAQCLKEGIGDAWEIRRMVEAYRAEGYPEQAGLWAGGQIIRRNGATDDFNERWLKEFLRFRTGRDQFSLAYTVNKLGMKPVIIPGSHLGNDYWGYNFHAAFVDKGDNPRLSKHYDPYRDGYERLGELCR